MFRCFLSFALICLSLALLLLPVTGQQYCVECAMPCEMTTETTSYDWWWCSCPTDAGCIGTGICTECFESGFGWCYDEFNSCETFWEPTYSSNCGCENTAD